MDSYTSRFDYHGLLGEGASSQVFHATEIKTGRAMALKVAHKSLARHAGFRFRWLRESAMAIRLAHPSIVPICDYGQLENGSLFMAMAIAEKGSLLHVWKKGVLLKEALEHLQSVLMGLAYIHAHGIVHMDIKPDNILVSDVAWLSDFSVARTISEVMVNPKEVAGSPGWMSPEQINRSAKDIGPWTDLYAWGLMLDRLLQNADSRALFEPLIAACVSPAPADRISSAALAARHLALLIQQCENLSERIFYKPIFTSPEVSSTHLEPLSSDFNLQLPSLPRPLWTHATAMFMAPSLREWSSVQEKVWSLAKSVIDDGCNKAVILVGEAGLGKQKLITALSRKLAYVGLMNRYRLLHNASPYSSGHIIPIREILAPHGEEPNAFITRWASQISQLFGDSNQEAVEKASALASWCGLQSSQAVDAHLGLMFYLRFIQAKSDLPAACLLSSESHLTTLPGGGLSLCEALLSDSFGPRPVLVLCALDSSALKEAKTRARLNRLTEMGAIRIDLSALTTTDIGDHLHLGWGLSSETARQLAPHCKGSLRNAREMVRYFAGIGALHSTESGAALDNCEIPSTLDLLVKTRLMQAIEEMPAPSASLFLLQLIAFSDIPMTMAMLVTYDAQATEALASSGIIIQRGRWAFLESGAARTILKSGDLAPTDPAAIYRELAQIWLLNTTEDPLRRDVFIGRALCLGNDLEEGVPLLIAAATRAFERREYLLAEHGAEACFHASRIANDHSTLIQTWVLGLRISRMKESFDLMQKWLDLKPADLDLQSQLWGEIHKIWLEMHQSNGAVEQDVLFSLKTRSSALQKWPGAVACNTLLAEIARRNGHWRLVDEYVSTAAFFAELNDPRWPQIWRLRAASWIHLGLEANYADKIEVYLKRAIGSIWRFMHGVCTKAEMATRQLNFKAASSLWVRGKTLSALTDSSAIHWECMCSEAAAIAMSGDLVGAASRYEASARFAMTRGWNEKSRLATLYALGVQENEGLFRESMKNMELPPMELGHIWSLLLARRHMIIADSAGLAAWWHSACRFGLKDEWSISVCPMIISLLSWANSHLPSVATEMERELSRISGAERLGKIPLYELALNDT